MNALKIETAGIQKYIFSSNKLKVNLGASYIIEHLLYKELLKTAISEIYGIESAGLISNWFEVEKTEDLIKNNMQLKIGYIGGGNALLLSNNAKKLKALNILFKKSVLEAFPGLEVYSGIISIFGAESTDEDFLKYNKILNEEVNSNRSNNPFINFIPNHGFYNKCLVTGDVALKYWKTEEKWVSDEVYSKIQYCENIEKDKNSENPTDGHDANKKHEEDLLDEDQRELFTFPIDFEDLSANANKNYIAIVHIDGNNLGNAFIKSNSLESTQKLSLKIRELGTKALKETIQESIIQKITPYTDKKQGSQIKEEQSKSIPNLNTEERYNFKLGKIRLVMGKDKKDPKYIDKLQLPIRPIITGGDDITFVCEGSIGIPLAKLFLEKFHKIGKSMEILNGDVHACAGVAIVKRKYPFYRAYELSEQLVHQAKKTSRVNNGSYLSFMIAGYGTGTSLEDLKNKYASPELFYETFGVLNGQNSISDLENLLRAFNKKTAEGKYKIPRNKLMQVREAIVNGDLKTVWPAIASRIGSEWNPVNKESLNFEAIEILDFYEEIFLQNENT